MKTIPIEQLKLGMYIERLDRSWLTTPFLRHRFVLRDPHDITLLKQYGIKSVIIDPTKGLDTDEHSAAPTTPPPDPVQALAPPAQPMPEKTDTSPNTSLPTREEIAIARLVHSESVTAIQRILEGITSAVRFDSPALHTMVGRIHTRLIEHRSAMMTVARLQQIQRFDAHIFSHVVNVSVLAMAIGIEQNLDAQTLEELAMGALLHDVGEVRLPLNLFRKGDAITAHERTLIQQHPRLGATMLNESHEVSSTVRRIIAEHHERNNGTGYPTGLHGADIAPLSQLVGMVDAYDALVTSRYGRPAITPPQAIRHIYKLGLAGQFDKGQVEHLIQCLGVYPIGSLVELSTGERAVVVSVRPELSMKPSLKIISDAKGRHYAEPLLLDLSDPESGSPERSIRRDLDPYREQCRIESYLTPQ